jgi:hypothetical protein
MSRKPRSPAARRKAALKRAADGQPIHNFRTLLQDLANLTRNSVRFGDARPTTILARPTPIQTRAFQLLGVKMAAQAALDPRIESHQYVTLNKPGSSG